VLEPPTAALSTRTFWQARMPDLKLSPNLVVELALIAVLVGGIATIILRLWGGTAMTWAVPSRRTVSSLGTTTMP
jgi:hypothetical protein